MRIPSCATRLLLGVLLGLPLGGRLVEAFANRGARVCGVDAERTECRSDCACVTGDDLEPASSCVVIHRGRHLEHLLVRRPQILAEHARHPTRQEMRAGLKLRLREETCSYEATYRLPVRR